MKYGSTYTPAPFFSKIRLSIQIGTAAPIGSGLQFFAAFAESRLHCKLPQVFQRNVQVLRPRGGDGQNFAGDRMGQAQFFRMYRGA